VIDLFDADAFGTDPVTVTDLPSTGVEVSPRRRKRGAILMSFL
jgi:hypothetical protein